MILLHLQRSIRDLQLFKTESTLYTLSTNMNGLITVSGTTHVF